jgi:pheromone shutdown protein TraB
LTGKRGEGKGLKGALKARVWVDDISASSVMVLGTIKGLVSERELVREAALLHEPDIIAVHIGKEELRGLEAVVTGEVKNTYLSSYEKVYARELSRFGEVQIPPPSLVESMEIAGELDIPLAHLDYGDEKYSTLYTKYVGGMTMIRQSLRLKKVNKRKFRSSTAEEFVAEWDETANRLKGYKKLEESRERRMASRIRKLTGRYGRIMAVVELERKEGIIKNLE